MFSNTKNEKNIIAKSSMTKQTQKTKVKNRKVPIQHIISKSLSTLISEEKNPFTKFWLFTVYNYDGLMSNGKKGIENLYEIVNKYKTLLRYIIFSGEKCPTTGKKHIQGYVELNDRVRRKKFQEITGCDSHWCEARKAADNKRVISYCCKPNEDWPAPEYDSYDYEKQI